MKSVSIIITMLFLLTGSTSSFGKQSPDKWDRVWEMKPGIFRVMKNNQIGIINSNDSILVPCIYDQVYDLDDDNYVKVLKDLKIGLYHLDKGLVLPVEYDQIWPFSDGKAKVLKNRQLGYINQDGTILIPCEYNHISVDDEGYFKVLKNGKMGLIDADGIIVLSTDYNEIGSFADNLAKVLKNGKSGYVDRNGLEVIPPIYDDLTNFKDGITKAQKGGQTIYLDTSGRITEAPVVPQKETPEESTKTTTGTKNGECHPGPAIRIGRDQVDSKRTEQGREFTLHSGTRTSKKRPKYFEGHLESFNIGINSYVDRDFNENVPEGYEFMELIHEKSVELSGYPWQQSLRLIGSNVGMVSAIGIKFNNYRFDLNDLSDLNETSVAWFPPFSETARVGKAKLTILSVNVPLMLEFQIPNSRDKENFYVAAGVLGEMRLRSHTKIIYQDDRSSFKRKKRDDFDLNTFRYSYIARVGYNNFGLFGTYSPVALFKTDRGPELYPFSIGISFNFD